MRRNEISEIRRRFNVERNNISAIRCCYVNDKNEIVATFSTLPELLPHEDAEKYMSIFKRTLSGQPGRNLLNIDFTSKQVMESREHKNLMALRDNALRDDEIVASFFRLIKGSVHLEGGYVIMLAYDAYDVPKRKQKSLDEDESPAAGLDSEEVFRYIICSICPVKQTKTALTWMEDKNAFHEKLPDWIITSPELGFLFPSFDDRATNIYRALHYTRNTAEVQEDMIRQVFGSDSPMAAAVQRETFGSVLREALGEECSLEVVQNVHDQLLNKIEETKEKKSALMPVVTGEEVKELLQDCGVSEAKAQAFEEKINSELGDGALSAQNLMDAKRFEVKTPDVTIRVNPERGDLVETRIIDGTKYILIRAEDSVEVNGIEVDFK